MEKIIDPVDKSLLLAELKEEYKLRDTNKGGNVLYDISGLECPNVLMEIGRLREISFREAGGSSGLSADLDDFDTMERPYRQLVVWDPQAQAILGGYRYILGSDVRIQEDGQPYMTSSHLFKFSDKFVKYYLIHTMELGRAFVAPEYQSSKAGAKAIFAMDNLWDGIAAVIMLHPDIRYFLGKMTIYSSYDETARVLIESFLWKYYGDTEELVRPYNMYENDVDPRLLRLIINGKDVKEDYTKLKSAISSLGTSIPPMVNSYIRTSPTMKMFGTAVNDQLADAFEIGIMVDFDEMYDEKRDRHAESFLKYRTEQMRKRFPSLEDGFEEKLKRRWLRRRKKANMNGFDNPEE